MEQEHVNTDMLGQKDKLDEIELEFLDKDENVIKDLDSEGGDMPPLDLHKKEDDEDEEEDETSPIEDAGE
eukprot:8479272-Ditylum_brightwellii.AAC.1